MTFLNYNKIQFNNLFKVAQMIFGDAINDWTFGGVEVTDTSSLRYYPTIGVVTIGINKLVIDKPALYVFHLSHEVCNLLHPSMEFPSQLVHPRLVINEGLSTWFQILVMQNLNRQEHFFARELDVHKPGYYNAYLLVDELLEYNTGAITMLRKVQPRIDRLAVDDFEKAGVPAPMELRRRLLEPFCE